VNSGHWNGSTVCPFHPSAHFHRRGLIDDEQIGLEVIEDGRTAMYGPAESNRGFDGRRGSTEHDVSRDAQRVGQDASPNEVTETKVGTGGGGKEYEGSGGIRHVRLRGPRGMPQSPA
jgi:hypothetical protein